MERRSNAYIYFLDCGRFAGLWWSCVACGTGALAPFRFAASQWPSKILASYLVRKGPKYLEKKNILELGSGTGLVGLAIGTFSDAKIWITDQPSVNFIFPDQSQSRTFSLFFFLWISPLLSIMNRNIRLNALENSVAVAELNWLVTSSPGLQGRTLKGIFGFV